MEDSLLKIRHQVVACARCPRLVKYRCQVAEQKRRAYRDWDYWGKPVPGFGDPKARLLVIGLAPAAHGGNRTGRVFTGDSSGDLLFRTLHRTGFANQDRSVSRDDGLQLRDAYVTAAVRCAPPANKPLPVEFRNCRQYLERELALLRSVRITVALGKIAFDTYLAILRDDLQDRGLIRSRSPYRFCHGATYTFPAPLPTLIASYHPSRQNTNTGKLTPAMFLGIFEKAKSLLAKV
ncbi:MAG: uracil-DNA glycosylase [Acidobacteria bacterium RIFCSPLOWO2_02_FULL_59_13]|nr:MAG: uracil-DNA glycosylase [Acidobacteria bacterium RIFCSPLOWO2_02_FULL_59_13]